MKKDQYISEPQLVEINEASQELKAEAAKAKKAEKSELLNIGNLTQYK